MKPALDHARDNLRNGRAVLVYDGDHREAEVDLFVPAWSVTPAQLAQLRLDAGGLIFVALEHGYADAVGLPMLEPMLEAAGDLAQRLIPERLPYDARSSFSLWINHRDSFTGITDEDRALTVGTLGRLVRTWHAGDEDSPDDRFVEAFRAPGHVALCVAQPQLLDQREGHTELAVALAHLADLPGCLVGAEMVAPGEGALSLKEAEAYAAEHDLPLVHRDEIAAAWRSLETAEAAPTTA